MFGASSGRFSGLRGWWVAAVACVALLAPGVAQAKWLRAESDHFVIYSNGDEQVLRDYSRRLEDFDSVLRYYHGLPVDAPVDRKLDIYLMRSVEDLQRSFGTGSLIAGFYSADDDDVFAAAYRSRDKDDRDETLFHEYVHHFMAQYFPYPYPAWLSEGWAEYFSTTDIRADRIDVGNAGDRAYSLSLDWVPIEYLLGKTAWGLSAEKGAAFYAQAWLLTHYMQADAGRQKQLGAYMRAVAEGQDPVKAMEVATGADVKALERELRAYARKPLGYVRHGRQVIPRAVTVTTMPASADDLLILRQRVLWSFDEKEAPAYLAKVRSAAARHPGDRFAELTLARAEIDHGDPLAAEALLGRRLAADPNDVEVLRLLARSKLKAGRADGARRAALFAEARPLLAKAIKADPDHYQTLYAYALARSTDPDYPSENTLDVLLLANQIAPQVETIAFETARALAARGRTDEATVKLRLLANAPHSGPVVEAAKAELERLAGKSSPAKAAATGGGGQGSAG
ncbi:hypothetical protein [Caulobacter sp. 17J65-9]|uniref:tetratricopeptide repeat protein n=1 Tax=Caulobacter sp. 17J65-9 TaxID=2709382 RepID=UPI0013C95B49|nr:hypothetical protein [Caulobacter sp. 17J65-9]NEX93856.1 hypothetical protein [Caulobacter sp. 17J65-9]